MAFTYDLDTADADRLLISKVRLEIGDTVLNNGVKPDSSNFSDEEILVLLDREGDDFKRACAALLSILSNMWSGVANIQVGPRREDLSQVSKQYSARAKLLQEQSGAGSAKSFSAGFKRADGYAEINDSPSDYS